MRANFKTNQLGNCQVERIDNEQPELKKIDLEKIQHK